MITKSAEFWGPTDFHEDIISHHNLRDESDRILLVRVEITPPSDDYGCSDYTKWKFIGPDDPTYYPEWTFSGDLLLEKRTREALFRRAKKDKWFIEANGNQLIGGYGVKLTGESCCNLVGGSCSKLIGKDFAQLTGGYRSILIGGYGSVLTGDLESTLTGGINSTLIFRYLPNPGERCRVIIGYVGENGIEPNIPYTIKNGKILQAE